MRPTSVFVLLTFFGQTIFAQPLSKKKEFTHADTLRGTVGPERAWWDVTSYAINVKPDFESKSIEGVTEIRFKVLDSKNKMQVDLQQPLKVSSFSWNGKELKSEREGNVYWVDFGESLKKGTNQTLTVKYSGVPRQAVRPPWDGGWIWTKDKNGNPWMSVACQGLGASVWYPCKDHQSDEPDSAIMSITVPDTLTAIGNGRLRSKTSGGNKLATYTWVVTNPINNYDIIPYIGKYAHWHEDFSGEKGHLDCDYWVLEYNLEKAQSQFKQAAQMLTCFEHWFGPYPFYEDGYKLVEAPHLGMEHQSAVAYGNRFENGYLGRDLSRSGWGLKWDFIIVHESGHEWFGNNITTKDVADMWVHEGITNYSETIFTTCQFGVEAGNDYVIGTRANIRNDIPIIGNYGVNSEGSGDMYYKGGNMMHMIRQIVNDDEKFRQILRGLNKEFYHQTVTTQQVENYISKQAGEDLSKIFDQYLRSTQIPSLEYKIEGGKLSYRWTNCVPGFNMPLKVKIGTETKWIKPTESIQTLDVGTETKFDVDRNFYITTKVN